MNTPELQRLKIAWLAAKEAGDTQTQLSLLRDHPEEQAELIDFIAAFYASNSPNISSISTMEVQEALLPLTQRALQSAMQRVFDTQTASQEVAGVAPIPAGTLAELRKNRNLSKSEAAKGLRLGVDVWSKFESGAIELASLSQRQLDRLASFFQVSIEQFSTLLSNSQPTLTLNRRQTRDAAQQEQQGPQKQAFSAAIARSSMPPEDKKFWQD